MTINTPVAAAFVNETIRPVAERIRALEAEIGSIADRWNGQAQLSQIITNTADDVEDGRGAEGVQPLTGANVNTIVGLLVDLRTRINADGGFHAAVVEKACVRSLQVQ